MGEGGGESRVFVNKPLTFQVQLGTKWEHYRVILTLGVV